MDLVREYSTCLPLRIVAERRVWNSTVFLVVLAVNMVDNVPAKCGVCKFYGFHHGHFTPTSSLDSRLTIVDTKDHTWVIDGDGFHFYGCPPAWTAFFLSRELKRYDWWLGRFSMERVSSPYDHPDVDPRTQCATRDIEFV